MTKPRDLTARNHPAPTRWQEFEELCLDIWTVIWEDDTAQKNGRQGDPQKGVDVFGIPKGEEQMQGVQCKGKTNYANKTVTKTELDKEIAKAEKFEPPLSHFYMATSGGVNSEIQEYANKLSADRKKQGKFGVSIMGWDWILSKMGTAKFIHIAEKYDYIQAATETSPSETDSIKTVGNAKLESGALQNINSVSSGGVVNQTINITQYSKGSDDMSALVDYAKKLLEDRKPGEALDYITSIYAKVMESDSDHEKYRLISNKASAYLQLNETDRAAALFLEAYQYHRKDKDKALCNASLAHLILGNMTEAVEFANQAIKINDKNARAYSLKIQALKESKTLDELTELVPKELRTNAEIAHAMSFISQRKGEREKTREWIEIAYETDPNDLEIKASLALILIEPLANTYGFMGQLNAGDKKDISRAIKLYDEVIESYADDAGRKSNAVHLYNRGAARRLAGDVTGAVSDTEVAVKYEPDNLDYKKHLAQLYYENSQSAKSIELLEELATKDELPEMKIALAERLIEDNQALKAIEILESFIKKSKSKRFKRTATLFLLQVYIDSDRFKEAERLVEDLQINESNSSYSLTLAGKLKLGQSDSESATSYLLEAKGKLSKDALLDEKSILADELYSAGLFAEAAEVYEEFIDPKIASDMSKKLLNTYYRAGNHNKALNLCKLIQKEHGPSRYLTEMESTIYEDIGELTKAQRVCKKYLKDNPNDVSMQLRLAVINYRKGDNSAVDTFLDSSPDYTKLDVQNRIQLALLNIERGKPRLRALDIGYETRRAFFSNSDAHLSYVQMLMSNRPEDGSDELLNLKTVAIDTVPIIENSKGEKKYFIIEDREDADLAKSEYSSNSPISKKLIGKKIGDQLEFNNENDWKIIEIKSKYIHTLHESMNNFSTLFPDTPGLMRMSFNAENPQESIKEFLSTIDERNKHTDQVVSMYKQGTFTVGILANMLGNEELDTLYGIMEQPDVGLVSATGGQNKFDEAVNLLDNKPRIVLDLTGIVTITNIKITEQLVSQYGKPIVSQSTLDSLRQLLSKQRDRERDGYATIGKKGSNYIKDEITPERVKKKIDYVQTLIDWVEEEADILPSTKALKMNAKKRQEMEEILTKTAVDTALLASEKSRVLLSDDERLRMIAESEFKVLSTWSQPLLTKLQSLELITADEYKLAVIQLTMFHYRHTNIGPDILLKAAEEAEWASKSPFTDVMSEIVRKDITEDSLVVVITGFLILLWRQPITYAQRQFLTQYVVSAMKPRSLSSPRLFDKLVNTIDKAFEQNSSTGKEILSIISTLIKS
jgi:tetratricopeptide (TPR) repeat protein